MPRATAWSSERSLHWYSSNEKKYGYVRGANFLPSTASNQLEMWMDPVDWATIERELNWAQELGFNSMRIFLHDLMWINQQDLFFQKIDKFLNLADSKQIKTILVIFDSCWDPLPEYTKQKPPRPGVHNSRWLQSPGRSILQNSTLHLQIIKPYVQAVISKYGTDQRVLIIDLWNEPFNTNDSAYGSAGTRVPAAQDAFDTEISPDRKIAIVSTLLPRVFQWARDVGPIRVPLTVPLYRDSSYNQLPLWKFVLENSDVISFHNYSPLPRLQTELQNLQRYKKPIICTEYMSRDTNSTFDPILGYLQQQNVWAFNWGWVAGKSQTNYPWDSWHIPYPQEPKLWHHDVLRADGSPFSVQEADYLKSLNTSTNSSSSFFPLVISLEKKSIHSHAFGVFIHMCLLLTIIVIAMATLCRPTMVL